ncbi:hypothetical protein AJ79_01632 [Helicocarpus griseus UAMH5409]|uniref:Uncharacterized protein n=1 Tax=Helicocarpus griseus UAMH5409 TaxID=1447875 RepID=A0A2B7Y7E2_9EURO|nr:hypothetical protein AJ79_01632 [Helicocarpus griseus UAMH5409]
MSDESAERDLDWVTPFLALPHVHSFRGPSCVALGDPDAQIGPKYLALDAVDLMCSSIDEVAMANFLKHAPRLKRLYYSHQTKENGGPRDWHLCGFISAIEREAGSRLEELSICILELHGSIKCGKVSMRGFTRLQKLELPLEAAMCNIDRAKIRSQLMGDEPGYLDSFLGDIVPASVSELSFLSWGMENQDLALSAMFSDFAAKKKSQVPALREIHLSCRSSAEDAYKEQCTELAAETKKAGVELDLTVWPTPIFDWGEGW